MIGDGCSFFPSAGRDERTDLRSQYYLFSLHCHTFSRLSLYFGVCVLARSWRDYPAAACFFGTTTRARLRGFLFLFPMLFIKAAIMISAFD